MRHLSIRAARFLRSTLSSANKCLWQPQAFSILASLVHTPIPPHPHPPHLTHPTHTPSQVVGEFESATASLERSRALIQSQQLLRRVAGEGARAADAMASAAATHAEAAARIERDCTALNAAVAEVAAVAQRGIVDGKVVEGKVGTRPCSQFSPGPGLAVSHLWI